MIKPVDGQQLPSNNHSRDKILFQCDCGRQKLITWKNYTSNHTKSCGLCISDKFKLANIANKEFGLLSLLNTVNVDPTSKMVLPWKCKCGNIKNIAVGSVVNGLTKSCGCLLSNTVRKTSKYDKINKNDWLALVPNLIDIGLPDSWSKGSPMLCTFKCACGNEYVRRFCKFSDKSTCGKCKIKNISELRGTKFGKLTLIDQRDIDVHIGGHKPIEFRCDCGNTKLIKIASVINGNTVTCGSCNLKSPDWWMEQKFGRLRVIEPQDNIKTGSETRLKCLCACGSYVDKLASDLVNGHVKSCGSCNLKAYEWWENKQSPIYDGTKAICDKYSLDYLSQYFNGSFLQPLEGADNSNSYINFRCKLCNTEFKTKLTWIWHSKICSCGCINSTKYNLEIGKLVSSFGYDCLYGKHEKAVDRYKLDVYVEDLKLGIEYHGLRYHSDLLRVRSKHADKYQKCIDAGINLLMIYEDEWNTKKAIFKNIIINKIKKSNPSFKLRPKECTIKLIDSCDTDGLYEKYHYIGKTKSPINIGVFHKDKLIACMSIRKPSRQSSGDYEISRMVCDFDYRVFGLWSYILDYIKKNNIIKGRLITFSDNRLSNGDVYSSMGMKLVKNIIPDYYWVKNNKRFHKSSMRKKNDELASGKTEDQLRREQGYNKIWDYGKRKWEIILD